MGTVEIWCLRKRALLGKHRFLYFCLKADGAHSTTPNAKSAHRWFTEDAARYGRKAFQLGFGWKPYRLVILGNEVVDSSEKIDGFLSRAQRCFIEMDYHPFHGIERRIYDALRLNDYAEKMEILQALPDMLAKSDLKSTRELAEEIRLVVLR